MEERPTGLIHSLPYEPVAIALAIPPPTPTPGPCHADCDGSGSVAVDELVRLVRGALDGDALQDCPGADENADGLIDVSDIVAAVNAALYGCTAR